MHDHSTQSTEWWRGGGGGGGGGHLYFSNSSGEPLNSFTISDVDRMVHGDCMYRPCPAVHLPGRRVSNLRVMSHIAQPQRSSTVQLPHACNRFNLN